MATKARAVQVPGEPAQELQTPTEQAPQIVEDEGVGEPNARAEVNEEVAALRAQLEGERIARLEAEQRAASAVEQAKAAAKTVAPAAPVAAQVGNAAQTPQLTATGWVVPEAYGAPPVKA